MNKRSLVALCIFAIFYLSLGVYLTLSQEKIIYRPFPQEFSQCLALGDAEPIAHKGTRMYVYQTNKPTVILYHGNAGSACDRALLANQFQQANLGYIIVEYTGFSNDTTQPTHELLKQDVRNVISYINSKEIDTHTVAGESIGTGFATYHAKLDAPPRVLLLSPFTNLANIAKDHFWFYPTSLLVDNALDNVTALSDYRGEVTVIHGTKDTIIPYKQGEELFRTLATEKRLFSIERAGHNDLFLQQQTYIALQNALQR